MEDGLTYLSGAGPFLCPCPDVARAPGSFLGSNPHADPHYGAGPDASCCSRETGWVTSPETDVFFWKKRPDH